MTHNIEEGDEIVEGGGTHRKTWEATDVTDDEVTLTLADQAVGYVTGDPQTWTVDRDALEDAVDFEAGGVLPLGRVVKQAPDWERRLVE